MLGKLFQKISKSNLSVNNARTSGPAKPTSSYRAHESKNQRRTLESPLPWPPRQQRPRTHCTYRMNGTFWIVLVVRCAPNVHLARIHIPKNHIKRTKELEIKTCTNGPRLLMTTTAIIVCMVLACIHIKYPVPPMSNIQHSPSIAWLSFRCEGGTEGSRVTNVNVILPALH